MALDGTIFVLLKGLLIHLALYLHGWLCLQLSCQSAPPAGEGGEQSKVRSMATQLLAKIEENAAPGGALRNKVSSCTVL